MFYIMKKLAVLTIVFTLFYSIINAQDFLKDPSGRPIMASVYADVSGSPYLFPNFKKGVVLLKNGNSYKEILLNIDLIGQEVLFSDKNNSKVAFQDEVSSVLFRDTVAGTATDRLFKRNFPASGNTSGKDYFEVIADGKITLLKRLWKVIWQEKEFNSATQKKNILDKSAYYVFDAEKKTLVQVKMNKKNLLEIFAAHKDDIEKYISSEKIDFNKDEALNKLFIHYNSL